jgi:SAM-dependent methyltransferase
MEKNMVPITERTNPETRYRKKRIDHWDRVSAAKADPNRPGVYYHQLLARFYRFLIPEGKRVLELGCGHGDLLAALKPDFGVGIDFSGKMVSTAAEKHPGLHFVRGDAGQLPLETTFDVILLSDLVNDLWDLQAALENIRPFCHPGTRIVLNFYNNLWRIPLGIVKRLGKGADTLAQNWFAPNDIDNLLDLAGFEVVKRSARILLPLHIPGLSNFLNRFLVHLPPFRWFALTCFAVARLTPVPEAKTVSADPSVTVLVPARNEAGNIENILKRVPRLGSRTEVIFVEGNSTDATYETIERTIPKFPNQECRLLRQTGKGKGDAVRLGFEKATGDILMILDADLTVPPEDLPRFVNALVAGKGEFINGVRLVYPMEDKAMRFFNILGNKFFSLAFSWLLGQPIKDTLCGTKVLYRQDYHIIAANRHYFGDFDPFGDFDLLFGAAKLNLKITEMPIRYRYRTYGDTNISRWRHGWVLLKMVLFAARKIKFI